MPKQDIPLWQITRLLAPGPMCLVTMKYRDKVNIMAAGWTSVLSQTPPRLGVAIHPSRFSHDLIRRSGQFALSIPGRALAEAVVRVGSVSGAAGVDKFGAAGLTWAEPQQIEAPLVEEALAWIECAVVDSREVGDHTLFVGEVLAARVDPDAFNEMWTLPEDEEKRPLHHLGGTRFAMLGQVITVTPKGENEGQG